MPPSLYWAPSRTTSAYAENTHAYHACALGEQNYLRVRGEYRRAQAEYVKALELPPRARRIP